MDVVFTDLGTVKIKYYDENNTRYKEVEINHYLNELERLIKSNKFNHVLMYDKESGNLCILCNGKKNIAKLNTNLKKEFQNNKDTNFNRKIRELLDYSKSKSKFLAIDEKGNFDNLEEAEFYVKYLEVFENENNLDYNLTIKLSRAREYIINRVDKNSDKYNYYFLKEKKSVLKRIENKINYNNKEIKDKKDCRSGDVKTKFLNIAGIIFLSLLELFCINVCILLVPALLTTIVAIITLSLFIFTIKDNISLIKEANENIEKYDRQIKEYISKNDELNKGLEQVLNEINMCNKGVNKEVNVSSSEEANSKKEQIAKENSFNTSINNDLLYLINRTELLDPSDRVEALKEIGDIFSEYEILFKSLCNGAVFSSEEFLISKINIIKRIKKLSTEIESKLEIKKKNKEFDDTFSELREKLSSNESLSVKK